MEYIWFVFRRAFKQSCKTLNNWAVLVKWRVFDCWSGFILCQWLKSESSVTAMATHYPVYSLKGTIVFAACVNVASPARETGTDDAVQTKQPEWRSTTMWLSSFIFSTSFHWAVGKINFKMPNINLDVRGNWICIIRKNSKNLYLTGTSCEWKPGLLTNIDASVCCQHVAPFVAMVWDYGDSLKQSGTRIFLVRDVTHCSVSLKTDTLDPIMLSLLCFPKCKKKNSPSPVRSLVRPTSFPDSRKSGSQTVFSSVLLGIHCS